VLHGNKPDSFSCKFTSGDRVVVSGDKRPTAGFREWAQGVDLLLHEVYSLGGLENVPARVPLIGDNFRSGSGSNEH